MLSELGEPAAARPLYERSEKRSMSIKQVEALSVRLRMPVQFFTREAADPLSASDLLSGHQRVPLNKSATALRNLCELSLRSSAGSTPDGSRRQ